MNTAPRIPDDRELYLADHKLEEAVGLLRSRRERLEIRLDMLDQRLDRLVPAPRPDLRVVKGGDDA